MEGGREEGDKTCCFIVLIINLSRVQWIGNLSGPHFSFVCNFFSLGVLDHLRSSHEGAGCRDGR